MAYRAISGEASTDSVLPPFETLSLAHPRRAAAERELGVGVFRRIAWAPEGGLGACRQTVAAAVAARGGRPVAGWQIHLWPRLFIEALFHVVWLDPAGALVDLSAKYPTDPRRHSVFAPDPGLDALADPPSRYFLLSHAAEVHVLIEAARRQAETRRDIHRRTLQQGRDALDGAKLGVAPEDLARLAEDEVWVGRSIEACLSLSRRLRTRIEP